jgi:hypothetical protein
LTSLVNPWVRGCVTNVQDKDLVATRARAESVKRTSRDYVQVSRALDSEKTDLSLRRLTHPPSLSGTVRKAGIALALAPEPFTTVAGVAMIAGSFAMKRREPASLGDLAEEATKQFGDLSSLSLDVLSLLL